MGHLSPSTRNPSPRQSQLAPSKEAGNNQPPQEFMEGRGARPFATSQLSLTPSPAHSRAVLSPASHTAQSPPTHPNASVCSCFGDSVCPSPLSTRTCRCRRTLDTVGDHRSACAQSGLLRSRGGPPERAAARICREAGARVTTNTRVADLNIPKVWTLDDRGIEVIANGLPLWGGCQLAVDTTLVSPLTRDGQPRQRQRRYAGAALHDARRNKERVYSELTRGGRCRLVVLGIETGGRWSEEACNFLRLLAQHRARQDTPLLRQAVAAALLHRWSAMLTHAAFTAYAASLQGLDSAPHTNLEGDPLPLGQLLAQDAPTHPPPPSRLPAP